MAPELQVVGMMVLAACVGGVAAEIARRREVALDVAWGMTPADYAAAMASIMAFSMSVAQVVTALEEAGKAFEEAGRAIGRAGGRR